MSEKLKQNALKEMQRLLDCGMENLNLHYTREHDRVCGMIRRANENKRSLAPELKKTYFKEIDMAKMQNRRKQIEACIRELRKK